MTQEVFCDSLQHYVDSLRAPDHGYLKNVMYGFGQAASAQLTVTRDISDPFHRALGVAWQSL
eukprot:4219338-Alexandrium_andersonii.AAC.1